MTLASVRFVESIPKRISYFARGRVVDLTLFADVYDASGRISRNPMQHDGGGFYSTPMLSFDNNDPREVVFLNNAGSVLNRARIEVEGVIGINVRAIANEIVSLALNDPDWIDAFRPLILAGELVITASDGKLTVKENGGTVEIVDGDNSITIRKTAAGVAIEDAAGIIRIED